MNMKQILIGISVAIAVLAGVFGALIYADHQRPVSSGVLKDATFTVYLPAENDETWSVDRSTVQLSKETQVLTMTMRSESATVVITQQATPDPFRDIPNYYEKLLDKLHQYAEIQTAVGKVVLTRPDELKGGQSAVINTSKGTLMFAHPGRDMSESEWKQYFDALRVAR